VPQSSEEKVEIWGNGLIHSTSQKKLPAQNVINFHVEDVWWIINCY
jgi:hypothetical protein